jgi:peptidoglycan biosynthesis protein MviN/MurJ (putative lipid II flippase)
VPFWIVAAGASLAGIVWLWLNVGPYDLPAQLLIVALWGVLWIGVVAIAVRLVMLALGRAGYDVRPLLPRR